MRGPAQLAAALWRARSSVAVITAAVVTVAVYYLVPGIDHDLASALVGACCVATIAFATRRAGWPGGTAWQWFGVGMAFLVAGDALYALLPILGEVTFPSVADAVYLLGYAVLLPSVTRLVGHDEAGIFRPNLLDASVVAAAAGIAVWRLVIDPIANASTTWEAGAVAIAYPLCDLALLFVLVRHLVGGRRTPATSMLAAGVAALLASDLVYSRLGVDGTYAAGSPVDAGWLLAYALFAAAAVHPSVQHVGRASPKDDSTSLGRIAVLVGALFAGVIGLMAGPPPAPQERWVVFTWAILLASLCLVRLVGSLVQVRSLLAEATGLRSALEVQAQTDSLTGLPNRAALLTAMDAALRDGGSVALLFLDLDKFKMVNDTWGHDVGDTLLRSTAERLRAAVRSTDLVARLGGDEFAVLASPCAAPAQAEHMAARILASFAEPFDLAGGAHGVRPSIGISVSSPGAATATLLREADVAMYDAKQRGGGRWQAYEQAHEAVVERYQLAAELDRAIDLDELDLEYQPIVDLREGAITGVEALVRWDHPVRGRLAPADFVPVAEAIGVIGRIDRWVLHRALRQVGAWRSEGRWDPMLRVHVNFAPSDLADGSVLDLIVAALDDAEVPASALAIEVTESALIDTALARRNLMDIATLGITLALDDFGTKYAVLAALADLPFTTLKIDRSFVVAIANPGRARLFEGIVRLADRLGLQVVAEGVETEAQRAAVEGLGCGLVQGYLISRPVAAAVMGRLLDDRQAGRQAWRAGVLRLVGPPTPVEEGPGESLDAGVA